ncbi:hypothetical protein ACFWQL_29780 [Amycolatopsis thermoflava]|uniref:hypothetical protein n=1 Tax=Amycolatopsis thermoflava TaxID=84480 RepID=UPI003668FB29
MPDEQRVVEVVARRRFQRDRAGGEGQERHHASWPAFRAKHPRGHRITGRIYVFAGALPAGLLGLYIGWRTARRRRFGDHRRWMARSFALAMSIVLSRVVNVVATIVLTPQVDTTFPGSAELMTYSAASIGVWLSPFLLWVVADLLLERRDQGLVRKK